MRAAPQRLAMGAGGGAAAPRKSQPTPDEPQETTGRASTTPWRGPVPAPPGAIGPRPSGGGAQGADASRPRHSTASSSESVRMDGPFVRLPDYDPKRIEALEAQGVLR